MGFEKKSGFVNHFLLVIFNIEFQGPVNTVCHRQPQIKHTNGLLFIYNSPGKDICQGHKPLLALQS